MEDNKKTPKTAADTSKAMEEIFKLNEIAKPEQLESMTGSWGQKRNKPKKK